MEIMDRICELKCEAQIQPSDLHVWSIRHFAKAHIAEKMYDGIYVQKVLTARLHGKCKIMGDGSILLPIIASCKVLDPALDSEITLEVTSSNALGATCKFALVSVFVPKHLCGNQIPDIGEHIRVKIIGKRIVGKILCIGQLVST